MLSICSFFKQKARGKSSWSCLNPVPVTLKVLCCRRMFQTWRQESKVQLYNQTMAHIFPAPTLKWALKKQNYWDEASADASQFQGFGTSPVGETNDVMRACVCVRVYTNICCQQKVIRCFEEVSFRNWKKWKGLLSCGRMWGEMFKIPLFLWLVCGAYFLSLMVFTSPTPRKQV